MPRAKRNLSSGESETGWLACGPRAYRRPWALEEELFGHGSAIAKQEALEALETDLAIEQSELVRLAEELQRRASRIAGLRTRLNTLTEPTGSQPRAAQGAGTKETHVSVCTPAEPDLKLGRCEGFEVDSPTRRVGVVDGVRYHSRIDRPDLLEVRAGPLGRELLLIPVEEVEQILVDEGRLILRSTPQVGREFLHELLARLRRLRQDGSPRSG